MGDNKGMPGEEAQSHSLDDYDFCQDFEKEELEGSILNLGLTSFDVIILRQLPTKILSSCRAS